MQPLVDLLYSCIVRITSSNETGAGFFVTPRRILTCAHVVRDVQIGASVPVFWRGSEYSAQLEQTFPPPYPDLTLLHIERITEDHPCIVFDEEEVRLHDVLSSYGFPDAYPDGSPADFVCEGLTGGQAPYLTFKGGDVPPGFSGSPLLNLRTGEVCGMIRLTRGKGTLMGGRAIPVSTILQHFPNLVEAQRRFHAHDQQWSQARTASPPPFERSWNVPFPRKQFFTGREALLKRLYMQLRATQTVALGQIISGLGGIGKTQLAVEYAYRHEQDYQAVLWARAETIETLGTSYIEIARLLQLPQKDAKEQEEIVQGVKEWLSHQRDWLLILDNADEPDVLIPFLPLQVGGHLIVTTRAADLSHLGLGFEHPLTIPKFTKQQDVPFLLRRAGLKGVSSQDRAYARRIADELDGLPLALNQAGVYLATTGSSLAFYWELYQQQRPNLLNTSKDREYPRSVAATLLLSFERVKQHNPAAADLLCLCAFLAPDAIPEELLTTGASEWGETLAPVAAEALRFDQAFADLRSHSLISRDPATSTFSIHRLVQAVLMDAMSENLRKLWRQRIIRALIEILPEKPEHELEKCERLLPHALIVVSWVEQEPDPSLEASHILRKVGSYLRDRGQYREAEPLLVQASSIDRQHLGTGHPDTAPALISLAMLYNKQAKYEQAEPLYQQTLAIREQYSGSDHLDTAHSLNALAVCYHMQEKYNLAEPFYQRALAIREQRLGPNHPDTATILNNLANLYEKLEKYDQAELLYRRSLTIRLEHLGLEHLYTGHSLNNLANIYYLQKEYDQAEPLYKQSVSIQEHLLGAEHPYVAQCLNNLANLYREQGKYKQAESLYQRVLSIRELEHPHRADSLYGLAKLLQYQESYEQADILYQQALSLFEQHQGTTHPDTQEILKDYAVFLRIRDHDGNHPH